MTSWRVINQCGSSATRCSGFQKRQYVQAGTRLQQTNPRKIYTIDLVPLAWRASAPGLGRQSASLLGFWHTGQGPHARDVMHVFKHQRHFAPSALMATRAFHRLAASRRFSLGWAAPSFGALVLAALYLWSLATQSRFSVLHCRNSERSALAMFQSCFRPRFAVLRVPQFGRELDEVQFSGSWFYTALPF